MKTLSPQAAGIGASSPPFSDRRTLAGLPAATARWVLVLSAVAFVAYGLLWREAPVLAGDSPGYLEAARDLADGSLDQLQDRSPGYPLLLAATGSAQEPNRLLFFISLALHFASVWLLASVLTACGASRTMLLLFVVLLLLPPYVESAGYVLTETLTQFSLAAGLAGLTFWARDRSRIALAASAVALAYAALTRPTYQAFALVGAGVLLLVALLFPRIRFDARAALKAGGVLLLGSALLLGGFSLVNSAKFGYFGLTPLVGFNLSSRTVPFLERLPDQHAAIRETLIRARDAQLLKRGGSHTGYQYIWSVRPRLSEVTGLSTPELSKHLVRLNLLLIRKAPLSYLQEVARSALVYWMPSTRDLSTGKSSVLHLLWGGLHFAVLTLFGLQLAVLLGLLLYLLSRRWLGPRSESAAPEGGVMATEAVSYAVAVALIFYTLIISCMVDVGHTRHRASTDAVILFATFLGLHVWGKLARASGDSGRRLAGA